MKLKTKALLSVKNIQALLWKHRLNRQYIHKDVPYFAQWQSRELVEAIVLRKIKAQDDPKWSESGAASQAEYASWTWSACGLACFKMVLAATQHQTVPLIELGKRSLRYGCYRLPLESTPGLYYKPFVRFIKKEYGLKGIAVPALTLLEIKRVLSRGGYVMASVTPEIRRPHILPKKRGGHLILIIGYDDDQQSLYYHNPSGFAGTQDNVQISYQDFAKFFYHKGILIFTR